MENTLHALPFFCTPGGGISALKAGHKGFPFCLSRSCSHARHHFVPTVGCGEFHDHEKTGAEEVNLHFEHSAVFDALQNFGPDPFSRVPMLVGGHQLGVVFQIQGLHHTFRGAGKLPNGISVLFHSSVSYFLGDIMGKYRQTSAFSSAKTDKMQFARIFSPYNFVIPHKDRTFALANEQRALCNSHKTQ